MSLNFIQKRAVFKIYPVNSVLGEDSSADFTSPALAHYEKRKPGAKRSGATGLLYRYFWYNVNEIFQKNDTVFNAISKNQSKPFSVRDMCDCYRLYDRIHCGITNVHTALKPLPVRRQIVVFVAFVLQSVRNASLGRTYHHERLLQSTTNVLYFFSRICKDYWGESQSFLSVYIRVLRGKKTNQK
jgi:hypothetical protein